MKRRYVSVLIASVLVGSMLLTACGGTPAAKQEPAGTPGASGSKVELRYALWDANQVPPYQQCIDEFQKQNPNITVKIQQQGWGDYWNTIQTGFVSGDAPDVFTNHLAKYPEFANKGQLVDIQPYVDAEKLDLSVYIGDLATLWTRDGKRYGLPKDWDTIAIAYNKEMFQKAGIDPSVMDSWTWDPQSGGTFGETIAKLTLDANGKNALDPGFDPTKVVQYGFIPSGSGGAYGQTEWSWLAYTTGWTATDGLWGKKYNFDDKRIIDTMQWFADQANVKKTFMPLSEITGLGATAQFAGKKGAMTSLGSWQIGDFLKDAGPFVGFGRLPAGPQGRKSMFNGLADSIWVGTKHKDEAWKLVKFLASPTCQDIVGKHNVVFPATKSGVDHRLNAAKTAGVDISAFTKQAEEKNGTFLFPITDFASEISSIMGPVMDSIVLGERKAAEALPEANTKINALFK